MTDTDTSTATYDLPKEQTVRLASGSEMTSVGQILGSAFSADPILNWISERWYFGETFYIAEAHAVYGPRGNVYVNETHTGAAMWLPPGSPGGPVLHWRTLAMMWQLLAHAGWSGVSRGRITGEIMEQHRPTAAHFYLHAIGAHLDHQGKGIGSALLKTGLAAVDSLHMPAYLESSNIRNNPLYERFGFEVTGEHTFDDGPTIWFMWRPAR